MPRKKDKSRHTAYRAEIKDFPNNVLFTVPTASGQKVKLSNPVLGIEIELLHLYAHPYQQPVLWDVGEIIDPGFNTWVNILRVDWPEVFASVPDALEHIGRIIKQLHEFERTTSIVCLH